MKVCLVSLNQVWENKIANEDKCSSFINKASKDKADIIIFPEMTLTGFSTNIALTAEDESSSETIKEFTKFAVAYNIAIIYGVVIRNGEKALNKLIFINRDGEILAKYSKIHPFSFSDENKYFNAGSSLQTAIYFDMKIGFTICYDLRFPELYQALSKEAHIIINIANWPEKRIEHWNVLLRARAIENQVYMIGVNRTGTDGNNLKYEKSSQIIDPEGKTVLPSFSEKEYDLFEIDPKTIYEIRNNFPMKNDRKIEFYKKVL